jgi:alanyl-tRNA synthetase
MIRGDNKQNYASTTFWMMAGSATRCGRCSGFFYDHGAHIPDGPPSQGRNARPFIEIWNHVFMQFDMPMVPQAPLLELRHGAWSDQLPFCSMCTAIIDDILMR